MDVRFRLWGVLCALVIALLGLPNLASAQLDANLGALAEDNVRGYLQPLAGAVSGTLNSSIFQTGHVPTERPSFHFQANVMGVSFSDDDRTYRPTDPTGFISTEGADFEAPTIIGSLESIGQNGEAGTVLHHPGGFDLENFTLASPQLEVSGYGSRAVLRWISLDLGDADLGSLELLGFGLQHSISQYIPDSPIDLAVGGFFQTFSIGDDIVDSKMYHFNVTGSKRYGVLEPYVGVGFDSFDMDANYTDSATDLVVEADFDRESNAHLTVGGRLNFDYVILNGEFNLAAENGVAVGLAFGY